MEVIIMGVFKRTRVHKYGREVDYWYIRYSLGYGKRRVESIGPVGQATKTLARSVLEERRRQVRLGTLGMAKVAIPTLNEFAGEYLSYVKDTVKKRSWARDELCLKHLKGFFGDKKLSEIMPKDIDDYKETRLIKVAPATVDRELGVLRHLFNLADRWGRFFGKNPVSQAGLLLPNNQVERVLTFEEEGKLLEVSPPHLKAIIVCALNTGMRKGEIISLEWASVDLENGVITLEASNTKSNKTRRIPINAPLRSLLLELRLKSGGNDHVFLNSDSKPYKRHDSINQVFRKALKMADIKGLRFHDLRHTFASRAIEAGASIVALSKVLGHASLATTMRYAHPDKSLSELVEKVANFKQDGHQNGYQPKSENS